MVRRYVRHGASPRGLLAIVLTAKALALFSGRINVSFDDLAAAAPPALRHRILLNFEGEAEGIDVEDLIAEIVRETPTVPGETRA
jgi:MoxR-like ATPase